MVKCKFRKNEFSKLLFSIFIFCFLVMSVPANAQEAIDLYNRAVNTYFLGDNKGAIDLLNQALEIDPDHAKSKALLGEIKKEMGLAPSLAPSPALVPAAVSTTTTLTLRRVKTREQQAHEFFEEGRKCFDRGEYDLAKTYFLKVYGIFPGHEGVVRYLKEIEQKSLPPRPSVRPRSSPRRFKMIQDEPVRALGAAFVLLALPLLLIVFIRLAVKLWKSHFSYCGECGTRNKLEAEFCRKCGNRLMVAELTKEQKAWFAKFCWEKNPFTLEIIPETYAGHKLEISTILEKLKTQSGHILIIGGLGTGKTTLLRLLEKNLKGRFSPVYLIRPPQRYDELIDLVSATITNKTNRTKRYSLYEFQNLCAKYKGVIVLLLDEAHEFSEGFEQFLRTLGDLHNVILVMGGLPQTREKLKKDLPALFDRIVEHVLLGSLIREETRELVEKRIAKIGGLGFGPFTSEAVDKIHDISYGVPREILKVCDWTVTQAVRSNRLSIGVAEVEAYSQEIKFARYNVAKEEKSDNG